MLMRIPTPSDFGEVETWGLIERPLAAIEDYTEAKEQRRWENDRHCETYEDYKHNQSEQFVDDSQEFYRSMDRPIDRTKWDFLKRRKAWFYPPLGWERFASPGTARVLDLGCGDGDQTQRVAEFIAGRWTASGYDGFPMEIVGVDLNESRIRNAKQLVRSPHRKITMRFERADATAGLRFADDYFDYTLLGGVLEVLDDDDITPVLDAMTRLTADGVYVRDILDEYPGLYPRPELPDLLSNCGFDVLERHRVFEEPFVEEGTRDPLDVWPMNVHQVLFASAQERTPPEDRY